MVAGDILTSKWPAPRRQVKEKQNFGPDCFFLIPKQPLYIELEGEASDEGSASEVQILTA